MSFRDVLAYNIGQAIWGTAIALDPGQAEKSFRAADAVLALMPQSRFEVLLTDPNEQFDRRSEILASIEAYSKAVPATAGYQSDDGAGASPAASAETRTPSAQADQDGRTPAPSSPRTFELVRHHDVSGQTGTGVVAEGVQFTDLTAALRWRGGHPATAVWPNVEEILAVHGHEGATELHWLDERTCRVCGCTDESACVGGCYWVAEDLCSQCGDGPVI